MMNRKLIVSGMLVLLLVLSTSCGQKPQVSPSNGVTQEQVGADGKSDSLSSENEQGSNAEQEGNTGNLGQSENGANQETEGNSSLNEKKTAKIETYFSDDQMLELQKVEQEITYSSDDDKYLAALKALQSTSDQKLFPLWGKAVFNSAQIQNGEVVVNLSLPNEARLGAGGEAMALDALKQTLFQFSEVKSIQLLVDGQEVDTLMGHVELEQPLTRN
ncbi:GerMN domain-containing protein [Paenibacillus sp. D2_2]|uniref:GerMN domain-containing protein n=1 Tax=Paenibacillus sp. D2_2 TaxID=3073092 RepID=UPI002815E13D|nr:GerMN domain-containing protein [Paenibacillus sp. D2_2]WMT42749.1 GerMN domain-containing protein [Paenibacillus sp. D2_2]